MMIFADLRTIEPLAELLAGVQPVALSEKISST